MKRLLIVCAVAAGSFAAADGLRDPTRPPAAPTHAVRAAEPGPVLSAIIGVDGDRIAIFNGQLVRRGGAVGPYLIEAVFDDGVSYRHAGATVYLYLPRTASFKKPSTAVARPTMGVH
jgi:hypothetical protein